MTIVALLMRAWIVEMGCMGIEAKILADDVLMIAKGKKMLQTYAKALKYTHQYLHDMGAAVAPAKSYNFSSTEVGRKWLKETWWSEIKADIKGGKGYAVPGGT